MNVALGNVGESSSADSFHRPQTPSTVRRLLPPPAGGPPPSKREVLGFRRSKPAALTSNQPKGFPVAPKPLRASSRRGVVITSGINGRAMRAPTGDSGATVAMKQPSVANASHRFDFRHVVGARIARPPTLFKPSIFHPKDLPHRGRGTAPWAVEGVPRRWKAFIPIAFMPNILLLSDAQ